MKRLKNITLFSLTLILFLFQSCKKDEKKAEEKQNLLIGKWQEISAKGCDGTDYWEVLYSDQPDWRIDTIFHTFSNSEWHVQRIFNTGYKQSYEQLGWSLKAYNKNESESALYQKFVSECGANEKETCVFLSGFSDDSALIEFIDDNHVRLYNDDEVVLTLVRI